MEIFDKIAQAGQDTMQKAKEMSEIARYNDAIKKNTAELNEAFFQIGSRYYELNKEKTDETYGELITKANGLNAEIEKYKNNIIALKKVKVCTQCGAEANGESMFCPKCGAKLPELPKMMPDEGMKICPVCGKQVKENALFCSSCGSKFESGPDQAKESLNAQPNEAQPVCEAAEDASPKLTLNPTGESADKIDTTANGDK